ncbi:hypothetical protein [Cryptosporangium sp. NPDC048952]|uniref:hypothetical protein n=1 Tax=Cryptosporangium sp. NPDC048952 TaxID=3363961 RepID=UPI003714AFAB
MSPSKLTVYYSDGSDASFDDVTYRVAGDYLYVEPSSGDAPTPIELFSVYSWVARTQAA